MVTGTLLTFAGVFIAALLVAYFLFLFRNPDALRSERFVIEKQIIDRGLLGDSTRGDIDASVVEATPQADQARLP